MASPLNALLGALVATAFWTVLGYALGRHVLPRVLALGAAPVLGWAAFSAATLPVLTLVGFSQPALVGLVVLGLLIGAVLILYGAPVNAAMAPEIPLPSYAAAAVLALAPAVALLPKFSGSGAQASVRLADPIFDHAKIAVIDAMTRQGLPPVNPVFGEFGATGRLAYYYLWHFSAAELALPLRISGWEADIALTWFTAFASLTLMMGIAVWLGRRPAAAYLVVALAAAASMRMTLNVLLHRDGLEPFLQTSNGFAGWLFQSAWVPQHLMSASCVVAAMILLIHYAQRQSAARLLMLSLVVVAGFESSAYVGGVTFAVAAMAAAPILFVGVKPAERLRFVGGVALAALLTVCLVLPLIRDQWATVGSRGGGIPIYFHHVEVLGDIFPPSLRRALDVPAYWLILLPLEFPAIYIAGTLALGATLRDAARPERTTVAVMIALAGAGLMISWLLVGTLGDNNDLGLRAVLPSVMILIIAAAAGMMRPRWRIAIAATALTGFVVGLPDAADIIYYNTIGTAAPDDRVFARSPEMWAAVRRYASPAARIGNDPLYLQDLTSWPANISWALLADRDSCFAGREMALAFAPLPPARREAINAQFIRVFAGQGTANDVDDMAKKFACDVIVVVPQDGAWGNDPFATSPDYRLVELRERQWRIYLKASAGAAAH